MTISVGLPSVCRRIHDGYSRIGRSRARALSAESRIGEAGPVLLKDHGLIGDMQAAALVGRNGAMDWLCQPRFVEHG
jgi:hypothetical protein